jgi:hypothetical protein
MGRPLNKRNFGADSGNDIKVQFHNGTSSVNGYIVKQTGSKKFKVRAYGVATTIYTCRLVDKATGALAAGEMTISVKTDAGVVEQVTKITARKVTVNGVSMQWNYSTSTTDGAVEMEEAGTGTTATDVDADDFEADDANNPNPA